MAAASRDAIETCAPSLASARATALPSPLLAPPTIATLFLKPRSIRGSSQGRKAEALPFCLAFLPSDLPASNFCLPALLPSCLVRFSRLAPSDYAVESEPRHFV